MRFTKGFYWNPNHYASFEEFIYEKKKRRRKNARHTKVLYVYEEIYYNETKIWEGFNPHNRSYEPLPGTENKLSELMSIANWKTLETRHIPLLIIWFLVVYFIFFDASTLNLYGAYHKICTNYYDQAFHQSFRLLMLEEHSAVPSSTSSTADIRNVLLEIAMKP